MSYLLLDSSLAILAWTISSINCDFLASSCLSTTTCICSTLISSWWKMHSMPREDCFVIEEALKCVVLFYVLGTVYLPATLGLLLFLYRFWKNPLVGIVCIFWYGSCKFFDTPLWSESRWLFAASNSERSMPRSFFPGVATFLTYKLLRLLRSKAFDWNI